MRILFASVLIGNIWSMHIFNHTKVTTKKCVVAPIAQTQIVEAFRRSA